MYFSLLFLLPLSFALLILAIYEIGQQAFSNNLSSVHRWNIVFVAGNIVAFVIILGGIVSSRQRTISVQLREIPRSCVPTKVGHVSKVTFILNHPSFRMIFIY